MHCQPDTVDSSDDRDDAEEAADILNAIMGLSAIPRQRAPPQKSSKPVRRVRPCALTFRQSQAQRMP